MANGSVLSDAFSRRARVINPGDLRERITIQSVATVNDQYGDIVETVTTYAEVWAKVEGLRGREFFTAKSIRSERFLRFIIRYDSGVTPQMRISYDSRTFEIEEVYDEDQHNRFMTILAVEQV